MERLPGQGMDGCRGDGSGHGVHPRGAVLGAGAFSLAALGSRLSCASLGSVALVAEAKHSSQERGAGCDRRKKKVPWPGCRAQRGQAEPGSVITGCAP